MKTPSPLFLIAVLFIGRAAWAGEVYYAFDDRGNGKKVAIELIEKSSCMGTLTSLLYPERAISEGLEALQGLSKGQVSDVSSCLAQIGGSWESTFSSPKPAPSASSSAYLSEQPLPPELATLKAKAESLKRQARCYNPYKPGTSDFKYHVLDYKDQCKDNWLEKAEGEAIRTQAQAAESEYSVAYSKYQQEIYMLQDLPRYLLGPSPSNLFQEKYSAISKKAECYNPYPGSSYDSNYKQKYIVQNCGGNAISKSEFDSLQEQLMKLNQEKNAAQVTYEKEFNRLSVYFQSPDVFSSFDRGEVMDLTKRLKCVNPHPPGSNNAKYFEQDYSSSCKGKFTGKEEAEGIRQALREQFKDLDEKVAKAEEKKKKLEAERQRALDLLDQDRRNQYGFRRLLAKFRHFLEKGGSPAKVENFCEDYEKLQRRDKRFSELMWDKGVRLALFGDETSWKWAQKYGFTEGELAAMNAYIGSFYRTINPALWKDGSLPEHLGVYKEAMDSAMDRMPTYSHTQLRRFASLPESVIQQHQVGSIVQYNSYTSTSNRANWNWEGKHRFLIYSGRNGKDVRALNEGESEILFKAGTRFKVISRQEKNGNIDFVMAEVDENGKVIADLSAPSPNNNTPPQ